MKNTLGNLVSVKRSILIAQGKKINSLKSEISASEEILLNSMDCETLKATRNKMWDVYLECGDLEYDFFETLRVGNDKLRKYNRTLDLLGLQALKIHNELYEKYLNIRYPEHN